MRMKAIMENLDCESNMDLFGWSPPSVETIQALWKSTKQLVPSDVFGRENEEMHPACLQIFETIANALQPQIGFLLRKKLSDPEFEPDLVGFRRGLSNCTWTDIRMIAEFKLCTSKEKKNGITESFDYLIASMGSLPSLDTGPVEPRVSLYSDFRSILALVARMKNCLDVTRSEHLVLFPDGWRELSEPTDGFKLLCHAIKVPMPVPVTVSVDRHLCSSTGTLYVNSQIGIFIVEVNTELLAVKVGLDRYGFGMVEMERNNISNIMQLDRMCNYMVPMTEQAVRYGFAMPLAEPLSAWIDRQQKELKNEIQEAVTEKALTQRCTPIFQQLLEGIHCLHRHGFCHLDIRPGNLMMFEGTGRLIDWTTVKRIEKAKSDSIGFFRQGHLDAFWPDPTGTKLDESPVRWDLYGLAYSIAYLGANLLEKGQLSDFDTRDAQLEEFRGKAVDSDSIKALGAHLVKVLKEETDDDVVYRAMVECLQ